MVFPLSHSERRTHGTHYTRYKNEENTRGTEGKTIDVSFLLVSMQRGAFLSEELRASPLRTEYLSRGPASQLITLGSLPQAVLICKFSGGTGDCGVADLAKPQSKSKWKAKRNHEISFSPFYFVSFCVFSRLVVTGVPFPQRQHSSTPVCHPPYHASPGALQCIQSRVAGQALSSLGLSIYIE